MHDIVVSIILGIVEGITEFLPISSTGHLILAGNYLKFVGEKANAFEIFIQLGAIFAVLGYFRSRIVRLIQSLSGKPMTEGLSQGIAWRFTIGIGIAFIPSAVLGLLFHDIIEDKLFNPSTVAIALIVGGIAILIIERFFKEPKVHVMEQSTWLQSFWIGMAQCLSLIPGMSRSASTIMGARVLGLDAATAAEFSFFLAIPTLFAATIYSLLKVISSLSSADALTFGIGFFVSFVVAYLVIAGFMAFIKHHSFIVFGWYRIVLGIIVLIILR
ncbi:MAG: undecaprenyl-diphosphate phosphatase [Candidatus Desantisbacteria bacterium]